MRLTAALAIFAASAGPPAIAQTVGDKQPLAETVFKNVQLLKGIPVSEFMATMGFFSASLGLNCVYCHTGESLADWGKFAEDVPRKRVARMMIQMVNNINKNNFGGRQVITCNTCHNGTQKPKSVPSLAIQYGTPEEDPNEIEIPAQPPKGPSADEILDRYFKALGGEDRLRAIRSVTANGKYDGYETYHEAVPFELYAQEPGRLATTIHSQNGASTTVFNGEMGWTASPQNPVTLLPLVQTEIDGTRLDAAMFFPLNVRQALGNWRSGFPITNIGKADVQVIQGTAPGGMRVKLFFDQGTGLLLRQVRYSATRVGTNPIQVDYEDYRDVSGAKLPFRWIVTWTNGRSTYQLEEVEANQPVDAGKFAKPAPAVVTPLKSAAQ